MKTKIVRVKDKGTCLKYYLVIEFIEEDEVQMMERIGWGPRFGQYPYLIVELETNYVTAVQSHFNYPEYDIKERSGKMMTHSTNLLAVSEIARHKFNELPDQITEGRMIALRNELSEDARAFWANNLKKMAEKEER